VEVLIAQVVGGGGQGDDFGVGGHVVEALGLVVSPGDDPLVTDHDGPDRNFPGGGGELGLVNGLAHEVGVVVYG